ncbi:hypothetical protein ACI797_16675 [Geodermatophilus sp. SYSU D00691]
MAPRLVVADSPAEREAARTVEASVFLGAFGNTPDVMAEEYGPYEERSRFLVVLDEVSGRALGAVRLIVPDAAGELKSLTDAAGAPWHVSAEETLRTAGFAAQEVWDVATLAVDPDARAAARIETTFALCHALYRYTRANGVEGLVTILDDKVLRVLRTIGLPWAPMAGATSQFYLGSPASTPCVVGVEECARGVRATRPDLAPRVVDGVGFRSIAVDQADLRAERGRPRPEPVAALPPEHPAAAPRTGWRPPAYRRSGLPAADVVPSGNRDT